MKLIRTTILCAGVAFAAAVTLLAAPENVPSNDPGDASNVAAPTLRASPSPESSVAATTGVSSSTNYALGQYSVNSGGALDAASPAYRLDVEVGHPFQGGASSQSYQMAIGHTYGAGGGCSCPCAYDPQCDGVISDVLDVVSVINVAFRGQPAVQDPSCPKQRSDVDANGVTDVIDVTKVINVAFRGQPAASSYVNPCL
jgi:hypothetical protein